MIRTRALGKGESKLSSISGVPDQLRLLQPEQLQCPSLQALVLQLLCDSGKRCLGWFI